MEVRFSRRDEGTGEAARHVRSRSVRRRRDAARGWRRRRTAGLRGHDADVGACAHPRAGRRDGQRVRVARPRFTPQSRNHGNLVWRCRADAVLAARRLRDRSRQPPVAHVADAAAAFAGQGLGAPRRRRCAACRRTRCAHAGCRAEEDHRHRARRRPHRLAQCAPARPRGTARHAGAAARIARDGGHHRGAAAASGNRRPRASTPIGRRCSRARSRQSPPRWSATAASSRRASTRNWTNCAPSTPTAASSSWRWRRANASAPASPTSRSSTTACTASTSKSPTRTSRRFPTTTAAGRRSRMPSATSRRN